MRIYLSPSNHVCFAKKLMLDDSVDADTKRVSTIAMQRLPLKEYIELIEYALSLAELGRLDVREPSLLSWKGNQLEALAFPAPKFNTYFSFHYKDPQVINIINKLLKSNHIPKSYHEMMLDVLSGKDEKILTGQMGIGARFDCPVSLYKRLKLECFWNYFYRGERE